VLKRKDGNVIVTGCSHPGSESIFARASDFVRISGIVGGLHGSSRF
jgi:metal-dependent hydrolase (beta-lactamase superfamily II)